MATVHGRGRTFWTPLVDKLADTVDRPETRDLEDSLREWCAQYNETKWDMDEVEFQR